MTEQEQLQRLKAFARDVFLGHGDVMQAAFNGGIAKLDKGGIQIADWLKPTPAEIDDIVKKGGGPV